MHCLRKSYEQNSIELSQTYTNLQRCSRCPPPQPLLLEGESCIGECRQVDISIWGSISNTAQLLSHCKNGLSQSLDDTTYLILFGSLKNSLPLEDNCFVHLETQLHCVAGLPWARCLDFLSPHNLSPHLPTMPGHFMDSGDHLINSIEIEIPHDMTFCWGIAWFCSSA